MEYDSEIYANGSGNSHGSGTAGRFKRSPPEGIGGGGRNQPRNSRYQVRITKNYYAKKDVASNISKLYETAQSHFKFLSSYLIP